MNECPCKVSLFACDNFDTWRRLPRSSGDPLRCRLIMTASRQFTGWLAAGIGALALAAFLLSAISIWLNAVSLTAIGRSQPAAPSMRWSEIEARDDATFAANLHAIGCPEKTVAVLLNARSRSAARGDEVPAGESRADVSSDAAPRRPGMAAWQAAPFATPAAAPPGASIAAPSAVPQSSSASTAVVEQTRTEAVPATGELPRVASGENSSASPVPRSRQAPMSGGAVARRSGTPSSSITQATTSEESLNNGSAASEKVIVAPDADVAIPAAFQSPGSDVQLTEQQKAQQDALQQEFADAVQKNQDPSKPVPASEWQTAQMENDQRFKLLFGYQAFLQREQRGNLHLNNSDN